MTNEVINHKYQTMPWDLIDMLEESGAKHLTICSIDSCDPGIAIGQLIRNGQVELTVFKKI